MGLFVPTLGLRCGPMSLGLMGLCLCRPICPYMSPIGPRIPIPDRGAAGIPIIYEHTQRMPLKSGGGYSLAK